MPALIFVWNDAGFNDTAVPNCRNGLAGQTKAAIIANLIANGVTNFENMNTLFIFPKSEAIGDWANDVETNLPWYEIIIHFKFFGINLFHYSFLKDERSNRDPQYLSPTPKNG